MAPGIPYSGGGPDSSTSDAGGSSMAYSMNPASYSDAYRRADQAWQRVEEKRSHGPSNPPHLPPSHAVPSVNTGQGQSSLQHRSRVPNHPYAAHTSTSTGASYDMARYPQDRGESYDDPRYPQARSESYDLARYGQDRGGYDYQPSSGQRPQSRSRPYPDVGRVADSNQPRVRVYSDQSMDESGTPKTPERRSGRPSESNSDTVVDPQKTPTMNRDSSGRESSATTRSRQDTYQRHSREYRASEEGPTDFYQHSRSSVESTDPFNPERGPSRSERRSDVANSDSTHESRLLDAISFDDDRSLDLRLRGMSFDQYESDRLRADGGNNGRRGPSRQSRSHTPADDRSVYTSETKTYHTHTAENAPAPRSAQYQRWSHEGPPPPQLHSRRSGNEQTGWSEPVPYGGGSWHSHDGHYDDATQSSRRGPLNDTHARFAFPMPPLSAGHAEHYEGAHSSSMRPLMSHTELTWQRGPHSEHSRSAPVTQIKARLDLIKSPPGDDGSSGPFPPFQLRQDNARHPVPYQPAFQSQYAMKRLTSYSQHPGEDRFEDVSDGAASEDGLISRQRPISYFSPPTPSAQEDANDKFGPAGSGFRQSLRQVLTQAKFRSPEKKPNNPASTAMPQARPEAITPPRLRSSHPSTSPDRISGPYIGTPSRDSALDASPFSERGSDARSHSAMSPRSPHTPGSSQQQSRFGLGRPHLAPNGRPRSQIMLQSSGGSYIPIAADDYGGSINSNVFPPRVHGPRRRALSEGEAQLARQGTLLTPFADSKRASAELGIMLGNSNQKAKATKLLPQGELPIEEKLAKKDKVGLEARKGNKARVEVDVILESDVMVEGSELRGRLDIRVKKAKKGEKIWIGGGKVRVCGYEEHSATSVRHIFYHYPYLLPTFIPSEQGNHPLFASPPNAEGYRLANEGDYSLPFQFRLPVGAGAKGGWPPGTFKAPGVKYVVVGSLKLHVLGTDLKRPRSIAHFYRPCVVYPYIEPTAVFAPSRAPIEATCEQGLGWSLRGEKGQVRMSARIARLNWIAGQKLWIEVLASNSSNKKINRMQIAVLRTVTLFSPPKNDASSPHLLQYVPHVSRKRVYEETIEASPGTGSGYVGSSGWWTGLHPGQHGVTWNVSVNLPHHCLSVPRSRLIQIDYNIRVTLNSSVHVDLPINVVNFLSLDPPPSVRPISVREAQHQPIALTLAQGPNEMLEDRRHNPEIENLLSSRSAVGVRVGVREDPDIVPPESSKTADARRFSQPFSLDTLSYYENSPNVDGPGSRSQRHTLHVTDFEAMGMTPADSTSIGTFPNQLLRPMHRRGDTASYLAAVASPITSEEDMVRAEEHRRQGRQISLAALAADSAESTEATPRVEADVYGEHGQQLTPASQYVPSRASSVAVASPVLPEEELMEAEFDLDVVRADMSENDHSRPSIEQERDRALDFADESRSSRDTESRILESDLAEQHAFSSSVQDERQVAEWQQERSKSPLEGPRRESETLPQSNSLDKERWAHIARTRSIYGSTGGSTASIADSEIGQVVNAIRRDLSFIRKNKNSSQALGNQKDEASAAKENGEMHSQSQAPSDPSVESEPKSVPTPTSPVPHDGESSNKVSKDRQRLMDRMAILAQQTSDRPTVIENVSESTDAQGVFVQAELIQLGEDASLPDDEPELAPSTATDSPSEEHCSRAATPTGEKEDQQSGLPVPGSPFADDFSVDWGARAPLSVRNSTSDTSNGHSEIIASPTSSNGHLYAISPAPLSPRSVPLGPRARAAVERFESSMRQAQSPSQSSPHRSIDTIPENREMPPSQADAQSRRTRQSHTSILGSRAQNARSPQSAGVLLRAEIEALRRSRSPATHLAEPAQILRKGSNASNVSMESSLTQAEDKILQLGVDAEPFGQLPRANENTWSTRESSPFIYDLEDI